MRDERGQSLVMILLSMIVIVGIAAVAIDVSNWFAARHKAQAAADAAALAGANYMANNYATVGASGTATTDSQTYVQNNGFVVANSTTVVDTSQGTVKVTVSTTGSRNFSSVLGVGGPTITATAVASWLQGDCAIAGSSCAFIYGDDNVCSGNTGVKDPGGGSAFSHGVTISKTGSGSGTAITGDIISASDISTSTTGNPTFNSTAVYSNGSGCTGPTVGTPSKPYASAVQRAVTSQFPIDYRTIYSACGAASSKFGTVSCVGGFPSYCTVTSIATTYNVPSITTNAIYCDAGPTGTTSDPSTWNGTINVTAGGGNATYIAGAVDLNTQSNPTFGPAANNNLLAYGAMCNASSTLPSTCPTTHATTALPAVYIAGNGNPTITGDVFAPAGVIESVFGGNPSITGFLEGWDVVYQANGTVTAQGPSVDSNGNFISHDYLTQ